MFDTAREQEMIRFESPSVSNLNYSFIDTISAVTFPYVVNLSEIGTNR